jgi:hypothetical protein
MPLMPLEFDLKLEMLNRNKASHHVVVVSPIRVSLISNANGWRQRSSPSPIPDQYFDQRGVQAVKKRIWRARRQARLSSTSRRCCEQEQACWAMGKVDDSLEV